MSILFLSLKILGWTAIVIVGWFVVVHPVTKLVRRRTGFYTFEAARRAGLAGYVYAVDIKPSAIAVLSGRIERKGIKNITTKVASAYEIPLPNNSVDRAFMVQVLPEIPDKQKSTV